MSKAKTKAVEIKSAPKMEQPVHADTDSMEFDLREFMAMMGVQLPSWKRALVAFVASLAAGYLVGSIASVFANILFAGAMAVTGSLFVCWVLYAIVFIAALVAAYKLGKRVSIYIMSGKIDNDTAKARSTVVGWFKRNKEEAIVAA